MQLPHQSLRHGHRQAQPEAIRPIPENPAPIQDGPTGNTGIVTLGTWTILLFAVQ